MDWTGELASDQAVLVVDDGPIRRIVLNRPKVSNAINQEVTDLLEAALADFECRPDLRVGVVCGNGRNFCAGMDLREFLTAGIPSGATGGFAGVVERRSTKPLVAAVQGAALAGGFEIALACDLIVASRSARFGLPEVTRGLVAAAGGLIRLPRAVPFNFAMRACLTGDPFDAETAQKLGMVSEIAADDAELKHVVDSLAARIAGNAPLAVAASKRLVRDSYGVGIEQSFRDQREVVEPIFASEDAKEGAASFAERRPPVWRGR